ncbi:MAG: hypothetical protein BWZ08_02103 [candidate division BRC1 bacterium ADurb.BinA292]|nr:MAG: hypothetical protein BWZ08_02103 [candidate division BRC1 bacterium ADurb.BinA292]
MLVAPFQRDDVARQLGDQVGVLLDDVAPEHHRAAVVLDEPVDLEQVIQVDPARAPALAFGAAASLAELEGFVAADVEQPAGEMRQQLLIQPRDELDRAGIERVERGGLPLGQLGERTVGGAAQPAFHVPERVLVGDELDEPLAAILVQVEDLLRGEGRGVGPDRAVVAIGERVFGVQLELIDLPLGERVDQVHQRPHARDHVAADVEHDAAVGQVGPVLDAQRGERVGLPAGELAQRHRGVERAGAVVRDDRKLGGRDLQAVTLGLAHLGRVDRQQHLDARVGRDAERRQRGGLAERAQRPAQRVAQAQQLGARLALEQQQGVVAQPKPPRQDLQPLRHRQQQDLIGHRFGSGRGGHRAGVGREAMHAAPLRGVDWEGVKREIRIRFGRSETASRIRHPMMPQRPVTGKKPTRQRANGTAARRGGPDARKPRQC